MMKHKVLLFLITFAALSFFVFVPDGSADQITGVKSGPHQIAGVKVGDPSQNGVVVVFIRIMVPDPENPGETIPKEGKKIIDITAEDTPETKANKIHEAMKDILENDLGLGKKASTSKKTHGDQVTTKIPSKLEPEVHVTSVATGEEDETMSGKELQDFYKKQVAEATPPEEGDSDQRSFFSRLTVGDVTDETITNPSQNSIILKGTPSGNWMGNPGGVLNVSVGPDAFSLSTQGVALDVLADQVFQYYVGLGYEVTLTGDPVDGFFINTGYFRPSVQALDDSLEVGLGIK
ncbi:MAG: hypothetical protein GY950_28525 [bacterium]|nr:hypothetical protein [bacterium]